MSCRHWGFNVEKQNKSSQVTFVQHFHSGKNEIRMHVHAMEYKLCGLCDSVYELYVLVFACEMAIT